MTVPMRNTALGLLLFCGACGGAPDEATSNTSLDMSGTEGAPPEQAAFCEVVGENVTPSQCRAFEEAWATLKQGVGAISKPERMRRGETATVALVLGRGSDTRGTGGDRLRDLLGREPDETFKTRVGRRMAAQLSGDGFKIEPAGLVTKDLFLGEGQIWEWKVTALKGPRHALRLSAYAVIPSPDGLKENLLRTVQLSIPVELTWQQRLEDATESLSVLEKLLLGLAALVAAGAGLWAALKKFRPAAAKEG